MLKPSVPSTPANSYWEYLALDVILNAQHPKTDAHDEPLFIMIHQTFEIWFKLLIREIRETIKKLNVDDIPMAVHYLCRATNILELTAQGFRIMDTMTPMAFREFRDTLIPASGTQSFQFRELEILSGVGRNRDTHGNEKYYWEETPDAGLTLRHFFEQYGERLHAVEEETARTGTLRSQVARYLLRATNTTSLGDAVAAASGNANTLLDEVRKFDETFMTVAWSTRANNGACYRRFTRHRALNEHEQLPTTACVDYLQSTIDSHKLLLFPEFHRE